MSADQDRADTSQDAHRERVPLLTEDARRDAEDPHQSKQRSTLFTVCPYILGNEFCERLAFYGLATNLVIYLQTVMGAEPASAATNLMVFEGTCYLTPLLGAWLADSLWGRYKTILVFSVIYMIGMITLALTAWLPGLTPKEYGVTATPLQNGLLYGSLYIVAVGTGGIKPNVAAFGADQFDEANPRDRREKTSFFNWFYFAVNIGSLIACSVIVYVQENISWAVGFAIPAAAMALAVIIFISGSKNYTHVLPSESPITRVFKVLSAATRGWWKARRKQRRDAQAQARFGGPNLPPEYYSIAAAMRRTHSYSWLDEACEQPSQGEWRVGGYSTAQVEEVRLVLRMLPIFCTTALFWTVYAQMGSFFVIEGAAMNRDVIGSFHIPAASLSIFNTLAIIVLIPLYDSAFIPLLRRFGKKITLLQRIGWGLVVTILAMLAAAACENQRLRLFHEGKTISGDYGLPLGARQHPKVVDMNVFWQVPQYLLIGLSEVFASIGQLEFFYDQAPDVMRSCSMALQLASVAIGSYLSGAVVWGIQKVSAEWGWLARISAWTDSPKRHGWLPQDLNHGRLDLFFLFLAGLMVVNLAWFLWIAVSYQYKAVEHVARAAPVQKPPTGRTPPRWMQPQIVQGTHASLPQQIGAAATAPPEDVGLYGRSVTFVPDSPAIPAPFR
ncbi:hypothetical protein WJX74_008315 [Apatococcus lobatus]|uniref:Uncharacterized protein n=1 Tax=Apatococcus lobatus TaxID=904363 RepID=A0AAW1R271_9CHLO